jgi:hypothetical protein
MKKLLMASIILAGTMGSASADAQTVITNIASVPGKLQTHIQMEIEKTKEFQKQKWAESKVQFANLKKLFIKQ